MEAGGQVLVRASDPTLGYCGDLHHIDCTWCDWEADLNTVLDIANFGYTEKTFSILRLGYGNGTGIAR